MTLMLTTETPMDERDQISDGDRAGTGVASAAADGAPAKKRKRRERPAPPMSEIAQIVSYSEEVEREVTRTVNRGGGLFSPEWKETVTEKVVVRQYQFWASAIGSRGRYNAGESEYFEGEMQMVWRKGGPYARSVVAYECVKNDEHSRKALNDLISKLWSEGWQPTSTGQAWHDIRFRRVVPAPRPKRRPDPES